MNLISKSVFLVLNLIGLSTFAAENCTSSNKVAVCSEDIIKQQVEWACKLVEEKGKVAVMEINRRRYDCCGEPNYLWINDFKPKMIDHPIKKNLNGVDLSNEKDPTGKALFVEFVNAVKKTPSGVWVDYEWTKFGESKPSPKKSWVKKCVPKGQTEPWVIGSGTWQ